MTVISMTCLLVQSLVLTSTGIGSMELQPDREDKMTTSKRAGEIISKMSLREKVSQMVHEARGISRLNIPAYNWWNECLHGVGRAGIATVFPQAIGMAAMFDDLFLKEIASVISDEVRGKYNEVQKAADGKGRGLTSLLPEPIGGRIEAYKLWYKGLTCWTPNVNIFRDPRWGRGHETYGEDPYLTSRLGVAFVKGLQGNDPKYLKTIATPKHFAVHSGPEKLRHEFDAKASIKDMYETYLPAFKATVQEGKAASVMSAYNAVNGEPASASPALLQKILRDKWGFEGFVVSDCGAVRDIQKNHKKTKSLRVAAAMAVNAGCDLNCGSMYNFLAAAVKKGYISEETIDNSLTRLIDARIRLGMFDDPADVPYSSISPEVIDCAAHREKALEASRKSMVLLKNEEVLPLKTAMGKIAVIGPNADSLPVLLANYNGTPSSHTTALKGIKDRFDGDVFYEKGCSLAGSSKKWFAGALAAAGKADAVILCIGLSPELEGEEGDAINADASGDKLSLCIPGVQEELITELSKCGKSLITVIFAGSALDLRETHRLSDAVIQAWYPGQDGGRALAELIFGDYSPSGRLPVTFPMSDADLPPFEDYSMKGRTYRYAESTPLYPFGYGLSYSRFEYSGLDIRINQTDGQLDLYASVIIKNTGKQTADEIVQFYIRHENAPFEVPLSQLCSFKRISLKAGEETEVTAEITYSQLQLVNNEGSFIRPEGRITIYAGGHQPDKRSAELTGRDVLSTVIEL